MHPPEAAREVEDVGADHVGPHGRDDDGGPPACCRRWSHGSGSSGSYNGRKARCELPNARLVSRCGNASETRVGCQGVRRQLLLRAPPPSRAAASDSGGKCAPTGQGGGVISGASQSPINKLVSPGSAGVVGRRGCLLPHAAVLGQHSGPPLATASDRRQQRGLVRGGMPLS
ncbi:hypothetical protein MTO96_002107 [Rhipicephalus appendiculatus]